MHRGCIRQTPPVRLSVFVWVPCVLLMVVGSTQALGQVETPGAGENAVAAVTSNQPAAVDGGTVETDRADGVVDESVSKDASSGAGSADRSAAPTVISRSARPPANTRRMAESLVGRDDTPWYQTGLGSLTIVLLLVGGAAWAARRWMPGSRIREDGLLRVVGRASLTPKSNVALLRVGRRFVLLGVSGDRVSMLTEVTDPEEVSELAQRLGSVPTVSRSVFDRTLDAENRAYEHTEPDPDVDVAPPARRRIRKSSSLQDLLAKIHRLKSGARS